MLREQQTFPDIYLFYLFYIKLNMDKFTNLEMSSFVETERT